MTGKGPLSEQLLNAETGVLGSMLIDEAAVGPVMMAVRPSFSPRKVSLGTKRLPFSTRSTTGCRPSWISITPLSSMTGRQ